MAIVVDWLVPHRVILIQLINQVSLAEIGEANRMFCEMVWGKEQKIHLIADTTLNTSLPSLLDIRDSLTSFTDPTLRWGYLAVGGLGNMFLHFLVKMMGKMTNKEIKLYASVEEALRQLQHHDPNLPDLMSAYQAYRKQDHEASSYP